ncbi:phage tail tape measure protein [Nocardiopsis alba]|uniref:phage tail tape measure protein n=1 Tax=Nocardiopsis alba TaxID=53437 RepID=UPI0035E1DFA7
MALTIGELVGYLRIDASQWDAGLSRARRGFDAAGSAVTRTGDAMAGVGQTMTTNVSLPLAAAGGLALKMGGDFEKSMNRVKAVSGATGQSFDDLREMALELGRTTQFSASEAAEGMQFLAMAGFDTTEIMEALPGVLDLAAAGAIDLGTAADIASNILSGYGMEAEDLGRVNDILSKTFTSTNVDMRMLGDSFKYIAPVANSAGLQFEEVSAAVGLLGNAGIQGEQAGTVLRGAIGRLLQPTDAVASTLDRLGVSVTDSGGNMLGLTEIIGQLESSGADTADMLTIFGLEAGPGMSALLGQGSDALAELTGELENSGGTAAHIAETQMEGFNGSLTELKSAFEGLMIAIADSGLLAWATSLTEKLTGLVQGMTETDSSILSVISAIGIAVAAFGPMLMIVGRVVSLVGGPLFGGFGLAAGGAAKLARSLADPTSNLRTLATVARHPVTALGALGQVASNSMTNFQRGARGGSVAAGGLAGSMGALGKAARGASIAFRAMGAALFANPIGIVIGLVALLALGIWQLWERSETFRSIVTGAFEAVQTALQPLIDTVSLFLSVLRGESGESDLPWAGAVIDAAQAIRAGIGEVADFFVEQWSKIQEWGAEVWGMLEGPLTDFADGARAKLSAFTEWAGQKWGEFTEFASGAIAGIRKFWDDHGEQIIAFVTVWFGYLAGMFSGALQMIGGIISGAWTIISSIFSGALDIIMGIIQFFIGVFTGNWQGALDGIIRIGEGAWTIISGVFTGALQIIQGILSGALTWIQTIWSLVWSLVGGIASKAWARITGFVSSGVARVRAFISRLAAIPGQVGGYFSDMYGRARSHVSSLVSYVQGIPGRIRSALGNAKSILLNAGKNVIQGLIDGIKGMISNVGDAMSDVVQKVKDYLPWSPAKEGPLSGSGSPIIGGQNVIRQLAQGLGDTGPVDDAMNDVAGILAAAPAARVPMSPEVSAHSARNRVGYGRTAPSGGGVYVERVEVTSTGAEFNTRQVARDLAWHV